MFGTVCLLVSMSALYWIGNSLFLAEAINIGYPVNPDSIKDTREFLLTANTKLQVFLATVWTATFAVKFSFLTFFKTLIRKEFSPRMNMFFWFTIVFTLATWGFLVSEGFILYPYFGLDSSTTVSRIICTHANMPPQLSVTRPQTVSTIQLASRY